MKKSLQATKVILGIVIALTGLLVVANSIFSMTLGDQEASLNQQKAAEVEPLVRTAQTGDQQLEIGQVFAKLYVARFGENYVRNIAEGTSVEKVLNTVGIGHYVGTAMPGEVGNFALAGHRSGNGGPMRNIDKFEQGDIVTVETAEATFNYRYLESKIVSPDALGVIDSVPEGLSKAKIGGRYLTLTTCTPIFVNTERYIAWFELVD